MDEQISGRLELTGARARVLLGRGVRTGTNGSSAESTGGGSRPPDDSDARLIAARIVRHSLIDAAAASAIAVEIVDRAHAAIARLEETTTDAGLSDADALALESVIHVRGRPALRVFANRLESLEQHPGSELWQTFIADYEERIVTAATATGAAIVSVFDSGYPPWVQGSAWLIATDRVVTNRHVLVSDNVNLVEPTGDGSAIRFRTGHAVEIEFAADDRTPATNIRRRVTNVLYVAQRGDPVDIAVLAIEPVNDRIPLELVKPPSSAPRNLFVVGHPAPMTSAPDAVKAVFGNPDGRKRVSFGKRLDIATRAGDIVHDASTIGGYSGAPVVAISDGAVAGLHYYGDPIGGNLAAAAATIRAHAAHQYW